MNKLQEAFCDGAAFAYKDAASFVDQIIENAPEELGSVLLGLKPMADGLRIKAQEIYKEADRFDASVRQ